MYSKNYSQSGTDAGQHKFSTIPTAEIQRSSFDRSAGHKTTMDGGKLYPFFVDEALPGDTLSLQMSIFARFATPLHPIMDNVYVDTFYFAVPFRIVWDNWQKFCGEQIDPGDSTDFLIPTMDAGAGGHSAMSIADYMGIPPLVPDLVHSALFHRAYNRIYAEWFRDENLVDSPVLNRGDGPDDKADYPIQYRGKRHDYFTSCLPWPQKGPAVELPLGTTAPIIGRDGLTAGDSTPLFFKDSGETKAIFQGIGTSVLNVGGTQVANTDLSWDDPALVADLSSATAATINSIREAFQIQKLYERDARGGTRYTEILRSHFGVTSPDARLQRPEYLGGNSTRLSLMVVPQSSQSANTPQGELTGYGTVQSNNSGFNKSFTEHCIVMGLMSIRADLNYQEGLNKMFTRSTRWDFYWPALSHLGEQAVLNRELVADGTSADDTVFGYQERWAEYRYKPSLITARMRSQSGVPLDSWHLAQDFGGVAPLLDQGFIEEDAPFDRVIAVTSEPVFIVDTYAKYYCVRPMPTYSVPGLIDHF